MLKLFLNGAVRKAILLETVNILWKEKHVFLFDFNLYKYGSKLNNYDDFVGIKKRRNNLSYILIFYTMSIYAKIHKILFEMFEL